MLLQGVRAPHGGLVGHSFGVVFGLAEPLCPLCTPQKQPNHLANRSLYTMKPIALALIALLALAGCDKFSQKAAGYHAEEATKHAGKAIGIGMQSLMAKIKQMEADASPEVREGLKKLAEQTEAQMKKMPSSDELKKQLDELRKGIEKLDAQKAMDDAKKAITDAVKRAQKAGETFQDAEKRLREMDAKYQELEQRAKDAQSKYNEAQKKLQIM